MGVSSLGLVFALVPPVCAAASLSLGVRDRGVVVEAGVVFVAPPVFFVWEVLAEEKQEQEKKTERGEN